MIEPWQGFEGALQKPVDPNIMHASDSSKRRGGATQEQPIWKQSIGIGVSAHDLIALAQCRMLQEVIMPDETGNRQPGWRKMPSFGGAGTTEAVAPDVLPNV